MALGLIGRKCGMTRVFLEDGTSVPVSVIQVESNRVSQVKGLEVDGYRAVQVAAGEKKSSKVNKAMAGHYAAANMTAGRGLWEFRLGDGEGEELKVGSELTVELFSNGQVAKRNPSSIAIGAIKVTSTETLSPGITISVPSGNSTAPVTSVVLK
jgi:large subunit ribosomal protein L3